MPELRSYQRQDVGRMAHILNEGRVVWNLSEMRVGKLIELIALVEQDLSDTTRVLIVAPLSTLLNVRDEFDRWFGIRVEVNPDFVPSGYWPVVVAINPEKLRDQSHWVFSWDWDLLALDECHRYRGRNSKQTAGAIKLAQRAERLVLMTGTPLMNGLPREIWPLLHMSEQRVPLKEQKFRSFWKFLGTHAVPTPGWGGAAQDERSPWSKSGKARVQELIAPMVVRRTFAEVRPELPPLVEQTIRLKLGDFDEDHAKGYDLLQREWMVQMGDTQLDVPTKLVLTTRLRQYAASPSNVLSHISMPGGKVKAIIDWVRDQPEKGVIWTWHRNMARTLGRELAKFNRPIMVVDGDTPPGVRESYCQAFQLSESRPILIATISTLKEGITLDAAGWAAFAEVSWLPADNEQAAMRIVGPNQQGSPLVTTFVCENTIEERVERVLLKKGHEISSFMDVFKELA